MFRNKINKITLNEKDILHSLNYNIFLHSINCILDQDNIIYTNFKVFNHQSEIKNYYSEKDNILELYVMKLDKLKQLINNIALYLNIPKDEILYKYEKNIVYVNIYKLVKKYKIKKKFNFIIFFKTFDWIDKVIKLDDDSLKFVFPYSETLIYKYKILKKKYFVITASRNENEFIILDPIDSKIKIGIKYPKI